MSKCKYCGEEFKPKQGVEKFCSRECWGKSRRVKDVKINCPTCGDEFEIKPYLIKEGVKRFCSKNAIQSIEQNINTKKEYASIVVRHIKCILVEKTDIVVQIVLINIDTM